MIVAAVRTCPQRWPEYQRLRRNFGELGLPFPLRTFQTSEAAHTPLANSILTARAALRYAQARLNGDGRGWGLLLEDDVRLHPEVKNALPLLADWGNEHRVDCWHLCNRKTPVKRQFHLDPFVVNELEYPVQGSHALLLPQCHLARILDAHWATNVDRAIFRALQSDDAQILQVIDPILVEHLGEHSTFDPINRRNLEVNHAN